MATAPATSIAAVTMGPAAPAAPVLDDAVTVVVEVEEAFLDAVTIALALAIASLTSDD